MRLKCFFLCCSSSSTNSISSMFVLIPILTMIANLSMDSGHSNHSNTECHTFTSEFFPAKSTIAHTSIYKWVNCTWSLEGEKKQVQTMKSENWLVYSLVKSNRLLEWSFAILLSRFLLHLQALPTHHHTKFKLDCYTLLFSADVFAQNSCAFSIFFSLHHQ